MATVNVEKIVILNRFQNGLSLIPLIFYIPIGVLLMVLRCFIFIHALIIYYFLSKISFVHSVLLRLMFTVCGFVVTTNGSIRSDRQQLVLVANHMTSLDPFILNLVMHYILVVEASAHRGDFTVMCNQVAISGELSKDDCVQLIKKTVEGQQALSLGSTLPVLLFPEGGRANSILGLMKFRTLPFQLGAAIQPIGIIAKRWFFDINISTYSSPWWADLLFSFFVPFTVYSIKFMPLTERRESESSDQFCERVQSNLARGLGVCSTEVTPADVKDFMKDRRETRTLRSASSVVTPPSSGPTPSHPEQTKAKQQQPEEVTSSDPALNVMLKHVREVLPHATTRAVLQDLEQTRDVDVTITNILEGRVDLEQKPPSPPQQSASEKELDATTFKASSFHKQAPARQMSLQERKQAMLDTARQRYKEKHGIP
ncbi:lipid droplet-regulating VLDL assembly factor AUP1-like [Littorina saxatilis]|uniref:CUE domain-containing protein n=1 Tax=Littorina saxatilis TaxID=31220 RepID=A0AAN9GL58_9CAEN